LTRSAERKRIACVGRVRSRGGAVAALVAAVASTSLEAGAAEPGGASQKARFRVTLSGAISSAVNTYPDVAARCRPTTELGVWRLLTFRSARPTLVTVVRGSGPAAPIRFARGRLRRLRGEIHLAAPSQYEVRCMDGSQTMVLSDHFTGPTSWNGGAVRLASPRRGRIVLGSLRGVPRDPGGPCGRASGAPLRLAPGRLVEAKLFRKNVKRIVIRGARSRSVRPSRGCAVVESVDWTLVFRRIR
jgi:hypothetical protein